MADPAREAWLNEPVAVALPRREWMVIVGAAREFDVRVPREQGDGGACLDTIMAAVQDEKGKPTTGTCPACAGSGAQLCACDLGERTPLNCWSCSGRSCVACGGTGRVAELASAAPRDKQLEDQ